MACEALKIVIFRNKVGMLLIHGVMNALLQVYIAWLTDYYLFNIVSIYETLDTNNTTALAMIPS